MTILYQIKNGYAGNTENPGDPNIENIQKWKVGEI